MIETFKLFLREKHALAATEYAVMLALIVLVAMSSVMVLGIKVRDVFTLVADRLG